MSLTSTLRKAKRQVSSKRRDAILSTNAPALESRGEQKTLTVCGPYRNRDKWRLVLSDETGRKSIVLPSREEAEALKSKLLAELQARQSKTVGESLDEYRDYRIQHRAVKPESAAEHCRHLRDLLPLDCPIASITPDKARRFYLTFAHRPNKRNGKPLSPNTHQWVLLIAKCWGKWCVKMGLLAANPFASVDPIGKCNAGKTQLRIDEAQRFNRYLINRAHDGNKAVVGVLLMLHLGLRKGEVSARVARDIDGEGGILHIPFGKTDSSRRRLRIPEWLRPLLLSVASGKAPTELLFTVKGKAPSQGYWWRKVREFCEQADVPPVCPHSLRGLHATLAIEAGSTGDAVSRALGHTSFAMTAKHYASADSIANAQSARASQVLSPSMQALKPSPSDVVSALLSSLSPAQLIDLHQRLATQLSHPAPQGTEISHSPTVPPLS